MGNKLPICKFFLSRKDLVTLKGEILSYICASRDENINVV